MKDRILNRLKELSNKIEDLHEERQKLVSSLRSIDVDIHTTSSLIMELSKILEDSDPPQEEITIKESE